MENINNEEAFYDSKAFNERIRKLWLGYEIGTELIPLLHDKLKKGAILFVGINPSFSEVGFRKVLANEKRFVIENLKEFYKSENLTDEKIEMLIEIENISKMNHPYFSPMNKIGEHLGEKVEHIDLLYIRNTEQRQIQDLFKSDDKRVIDFLEAQIQASLDLIRSLDPKLIVVSNAFASRKIKEAFSNKSALRIDDAIGTYRVNLNNRLVPVFLSGMLSGQRALDTESLIRLQWHIKFVLEKMSHGLV